MTPAESWHPDDAVLQAYVHGRAGVAPAASVEAHLLACPACRAQVRPAVPAARLSRVLDAVEDRVDRLERPRLERLVRRLGIGEADARALLAAPALRLAWGGAVLGAVGLALLAGWQQRDPDGVFLLLAPLLPTLTTAAAYSPRLDPALGLVAATPYSVGRLLLARSLAVGLTALVGVGAATVVLPDRDVTAVAWLLPALALTLLALALTPRVGTARAVGAVAGGWLALFATLHRGGVATSVVVDLAGQLVCAALAVGALLVVVASSPERSQS